MSPLVRADRFVPLAYRFQSASGGEFLGWAASRKREEAGGVRDDAQAYGSWIVLLALVSLICVAGMIWGELTSHRLWGGTFIGILLLAYSFILLLLRKGGFTGV